MKRNRRKVTKLLSTNVSPLAVGLGLLAVFLLSAEVCPGQFVRYERRRLEGAGSKGPYETELTKRIDAVHAATYEKWIFSAWVTMLMKQGAIPEKDIPKIASAVADYWGPSKYGGPYVSCRAVERFVTERHGVEVGGNCFLATTTPPARQTLPVRHQLMKSICMLHDFQEAMLDLAEKHTETVMPGYTHIRHAQTMTFGHYVLSVHDPIQRGLDTLDEAYRLMSLNDLGAGALAGTSWPIDRELLGDYLALEGLIENTNDAVGYADGYVILVAGLANIMNAASRFTLDINYWSGLEYGFIDFEYRGLSTMMPQKSDNQPYLERVRVGAAKVVANLTESAAMGMRCPQGDMLEMLHMQDAPLDALQNLDMYLAPMIKQLGGMIVSKEKMLATAREGYSCATELANQLVREHGLDYRTAHGVVHDFVVESEKQGIPAARASSEILDAAGEAKIGRKLGVPVERLRELLDPAHFIRVTGSRGGVAPKEVQRMIAERRNRLKEARQKHLGRIESLEKAQQRLLGDLETLSSKSGPSAK